MSRTVMFWSRKSNTVAMTAGRKLAHRAQTGKSNKFTSHGRPVVVPKTAGMESAGKAAPCVNRAQRAIRAPVTTPMDGAKLLMVVRTLGVKKLENLSFLSVVAIKKVVDAVTTVNKPLVKPEAKDPEMSDSAEKTKMAEIRVEKISSVNLVKYLTRLLADVTELAKRIPDVHKPVHAYSGKKGSLVMRASSAKVATKASTGPVDPIMVRGCAAKAAYRHPQSAVEDTISTVPIAPDVAKPKALPKPIAGARQAKKRNMVVARHWTFIPSLMSDLNSGKRALKSRRMPLPGFSKSGILSLGTSLFVVTGDACGATVL